MTKQILIQRYTNNFANAVIFFSLLFKNSGHIYIHIYSISIYSLVNIELKELTNILFSISFNPAFFINEIRRRSSTK